MTAVPARRTLAGLALLATVATTAVGCSEDGAAPASEPAPAVGTDDLDGPDDVADGVFEGLGDPRIDVDSYDVELRADPGADEIDGVAHLVLSATTAGPLDAFTLDLRGPKVTSATVDSDDAEVVELGDGEIEVRPARSLAPRRPVEAVIAYQGEPDQTPLPALGVPIGLQHDDAGGWFTLSEPNGTSTWTPANDHPSDKATWRIALDVPAEAVGVASGRLADADPPTTERRRRWVWEQTEPTAPHMVAVAVGDHELTVTEGPEGIETVWALPAGETPASLGLDDHDEILAFYAERFGPYPDDDSGAVVVGGGALALEAQTRSVIPASATGDGPVYVFAHELAHQWFGGAVTPATWDDLWLAEAWATYADWLWRDHAGIEALDDRVAAVAEARATDGLAVRDPVAASTFDLVLNEGGALALHALRQTIGDDAFFAVARRLVADHGGANADADDLVALASDEAGEDLAPFFEAWLDEAPQPPLPG